MSVDLYERYKDALRRGHMALARGSFDDALAAYRQAVNLAPDRALPHAGIGQVLLRTDDVPNALAAFNAALLRAPRDEMALRGRGEALARLGRRSDAAAAFDLLSDVQEAAGRVAEARDATQRALDLAERKGRRRRLGDLTRRLRSVAGEAPVEEALEQTLRPLDVADEGIAASEALAAAIVAAGAAGPAGAGDDRLPAIAGPDEGAVAEDPVALSIEAEQLLDRGDLVGARDGYLAAAVAFEAEGLLAAAVDACYVALAFAPDDAAVHLRLVDLYLAAGWKGPAADKLALLDRLTELDSHHGEARDRIVILAADHFPDDPRLRHLTAGR